MWSQSWKLLVSQSMHFQYSCAQTVTIWAIIHPQDVHKSVNNKCVQLAHKLGNCVHFQECPKLLTLNLQVWKLLVY